MKKKCLLLMSFTLLGLLITGCGFHPHGMNGDSGASLTVELNTTDPYGSLAREVRRELRGHSITITNNPLQQVDAILSFDDKGFSTAVTAAYTYGTLAGKSAEQVINKNVSVNFSADGFQGESVVVHESITFISMGSNGLTTSAARDVYDVEIDKKIAQKVVSLLFKYIKSKNQSR